MNRFSSLSFLPIFFLSLIHQQENANNSPSPSPSPSQETNELFEYLEFGRLLIDETTLDQLDLDDSQWLGIGEIVSAQSDARMMAITGGGNAKELHDQLRASLADLLLPEQVERLDQLHLQIMVGSRHPTFGILHPKVAPELQLSEEQRIQIQSVAEESRIRLANDNDMMRVSAVDATVQARDRVLEVLSESQKQKYFELFGDDSMIGRIWMPDARTEAAERIRERLVRIHERDGDR